MKLRDKVISKHKTKGEAIYDYLKEQIMNGTLKPGDRIVLSRIAEETGTSEIPVREAIKRLETERLVQGVPHVGVKVAEISVSKIMDIYTIRASLEGLAAGMAVDVITKNDLLVLDNLLSSMEKAFREGVINEFAKHDKEFHLYLYQTQPNKRLLQLIVGLWDESQRARSVFNLRTDKIGSFLSDHRKLVESLKLKDKQLAEHIARQHRLDVANALIEYNKTFTEEEDNSSVYV